MSSSDLVSKGYGGYQGWGDAEADADYKATGGSGKFTGQSTQNSAQSFQDTVSRAQNMYKEAAKPAIESLEASKPEITSSISSKTKILTEKYDNLIASITGNQAKAENKQTVVTAGELGKRGIDPTSTLYGQELTNAVNPITQDYTSLSKDATSNLQAGIQDLGDLETTQLRNVSNAIAQLQYGASSDSISTAMQLYQQAQTNAQNANNAAEAKRQADIANALQQKIYETISLPESKISIQNTQDTINNRNSTRSSVVSSDSYYTAPGVTNITNTNGLQSSAGGKYLPVASSWNK
ncbi:hypothetical protein KJ836_02620 [Patescibacteria group bacterium]|nr:hypothetical protein [Patescibacteria group bacterium]